ncbi:class I SAM-dependent methyltransferase [Candidatus Dependentiae bacterium]|nr:class I SAM-dependent methyltransferase [Candidatus Dependentiae bacterium]
MGKYKEEKNAVEKQIWDLAEIHSCLNVLDIGIGNNPNSIIKLIELGANVTAIDIELKKVEQNKHLDARLIHADVTKLPFQGKEFDLSVLFFILHEISDKDHSKVIEELFRVSDKVMLVEPVPDGGELYLEYYSIFQGVMDSIGKIEKYRALSYWTKLFNKPNIKLQHSETFKFEDKLIDTEAEEYFNDLIEYIKILNVPEKYISDFKKLKSEVVKNGMTFSDINVIIAETC